MSVTQTLAGFPLVNQLNEKTGDGQADENARNNCVAASIAAALEYLLGKPANGDALKDAVYGQGYTGPMAAAHFVGYLSTLGVRLWPMDGSQSALVAALHNAIAAGQPALVTMPSQWGTAPADPAHPSGSTHVGVCCGQGPGMLRVMNPWGGFWQDESDGWWAARLCYGQVWLMERVVEKGGAPMTQIPSGWHDDGATLTAPNGVAVVKGFRDFVLRQAGGWPAWNAPLAPEEAVTQLEMANPALGGGTQQVFEATLLEWRDPATADAKAGPTGVIVAYVGRELRAAREALASAQARVAQLEAEVAALKAGQTPPAPPALTSAQTSAIEAITALKSALES